MLQSGDPFDAGKRKAGTKIQIMGSEWVLSSATTLNTLTIGSKAGSGNVSATGSVVYFSNPGEYARHTRGTRIILTNRHYSHRDRSVAVRRNRQRQLCRCQSAGQTWGPSAWAWDVGDLSGNPRPYDTKFHYADETLKGQPFISGCTIRVPVISQRILYYQVVCDNGITEPVQVVAVP
jgi:hypothetical protein